MGMLEESKKPNEGRGTRIMEVVTTDGRIMGKAHPGGLPSLHRYLGETSVGVFLFVAACILRARAFAENWLLVLLLETSFSITREISGSSQEIFQRNRNRKCLETSLPGNVRDPPRKWLGPSKKS